MKFKYLEIHILVSLISIVDLRLEALKIKKNVLT